MRLVLFAGWLASNSARLVVVLFSYSVMVFCVLLFLVDRLVRGLRCLRGISLTFLRKNVFSPKDQRPTPQTLQSPQLRARHHPALHAVAILDGASPQNASASDPVAPVLQRVAQALRRQPSQPQQFFDGASYQRWPLVA